MKSLGNILLFILIVLNWNCSEKTKKKEHHVSISENNMQDKICLENRDKEIIIERILSSDDLQIYLKPLVKKSLEIQILRNNFLGDSLDIISNGQKVIFIDSLNSNITERTFKVTFPKIDCKAKKVSFVIWYEFEHADITGNAINQNNKWEVDITGHGIVD